MANERIRGLPRCARPILAALALGFIPSAVHAQTKAASSADANCLACHGQKDLKSASGRSVFVDEAKRLAGVHAQLPCTTCHTAIKDFPHPPRIAKANCATCHTEEAADFGKGIHSLLGPDACTTCHGSAHQAQPVANLVPQICSQCHSDEVKGFVRG